MIWWLEGQSVVSIFSYMKTIEINQIVGKYNSPMDAMGY